MPRFIKKGDWGHSTFSAYLDEGQNYDKLKRLTTAVVSVCFNHEKIILTKRKDGEYDLLGGKIEKGETVAEALLREAYEEAGVKLTRWQYFGYYKVFLTRDAPAEYRERYPAKSYILFFIAQGDKIAEPTGLEIAGCRAFSIEELKQSQILDHPMLREAIKLVESGKINWLNQL